MSKVVVAQAIIIIDGKVVTDEYVQSLYPQCSDPLELVKLLTEADNVTLLTNTCETGWVVISDTGKLDMVTDISEEFQDVTEGLKIKVKDGNGYFVGKKKHIKKLKKFVRKQLFKQVDYYNAAEYAVDINTILAGITEDVTGFDDEDLISLGYAHGVISEETHDKMLEYREGKAFDEGMKKTKEELDSELEDLQAKANKGGE